MDEEMRVGGSPVTKISTECMKTPSLVWTNVDFWHFWCSFSHCCDQTDVDRVGSLAYCPVAFETVFTFMSTEMRT